MEAGSLGKKLIKKKGFQLPIVKAFRLQGRHVFLTYPRVDMSREKVLEQLRSNIMPCEIEKYVICTEKHADGMGHIHVYIGLNKQCNIRNVGRLDLKEEGAVGGIFHGNYQSCRS